MTPQEAARKFILDNFNQDLFEYLDVVEWMDEEGIEIDTTDPDEDVYTAVQAELDVMIQRYADEDS